MLITASHRITPFTWDKDPTISSGIKLPKFFVMAKNYNILNGYTFVLHDNNHNLVVLSITLDKCCNDNIGEQIENNKDKIQTLLLTTHEELTANYQPVNAPTNFEIMNQLNIFSKRENEIIYWASMGKSYQEIALILGIKLTTYYSKISY